LPPCRRVPTSECLLLNRPPFPPFMPFSSNLPKVLSEPKTVSATLTWARWYGAHSLSRSPYDPGFHVTDRLPRLGSLRRCAATRAPHFSSGWPDFPAFPRRILFVAESQTVFSPLSRFAPGATYPPRTSFSLVASRPQNTRFRTSPAPQCILACSSLCCRVPSDLFPETMYLPDRTWPLDSLVTAVQGRLFSSN